jgi:hypothetical protein
MHDLQVLGGAAGKAKSVAEPTAAVVESKAAEAEAENEPLLKHETTTAVRVDEEDQVRILSRCRVSVRGVATWRRGTPLVVALQNVPFMRVFQYQRPELCMVRWRVLLLSDDEMHFRWWWWWLVVAAYDRCRGGDAVHLGPSGIHVERRDDARLLHRILQHDEDFHGY